MVRSVFPHIKCEKEQAPLLATELEKITIITRDIHLYLLTTHIYIAVLLPEESWVQVIHVACRLNGRQ